MLSNQYLSEFKRIFRMLPKKLRRRFWGACLASILVAFFELGLTAAVSLLGVVIASPEAFYKISLVKEAASKYPLLAEIIANQSMLLVHILLLLVIAILFKMLANILATWQQSLLSFKISNEIGGRLFTGYMNASYLWHASQELPRLTTHLGWRTHIASFMQNTLLAATQIAIGIFLLLSVFIVAPASGLIVLASTGLCAVLTYRFAKKRVKALSQDIAEQETRASRANLPALQGIREVIIYRQQNAFSSVYGDALDKIGLLRAKLAVTHPITPWIMELVGMAMLLVAVLYMNSVNMGIARLTGTLALLAAVAWRMMPAMNRFVGALLQMQGSLHFMDMVFSMLKQVETFSGRKNLPAEPCSFEESIDFVDVSFRYPTAAPDKPDSLHKINMSIQKGSMTGLVGVSGAGKSTLVSLLTGLFPEGTGQIRIDGQLLTEARRAGWTHSIGYVPQTPFLLNATIAQNVAFSQWGQELDEARVLKCCHMAAMDFLDDLPDGIHTVIGERGVRLSGGQVQRVSIARALYEEPQMIIFDEATSALDGASEQSIQHTINKLRNHMTLVIVAHRLSTVENCDQIYWIDSGMVKMHGSPSTLLPQYKEYMQIRADNMITDSFS